MKKEIVLVISALLLIVSATVALAGTFFGEAVNTTGKTHITGSTWNLKDATGPAQVTHRGYSSIAIIKARTGSSTGWKNITTFTSTASTTHRYTTKNPWKDIYLNYTGLGKVGRTLSSDGAAY